MLSWLFGNYFSEEEPNSPMSQNFILINNVDGNIEKRNMNEDIEAEKLEGAGETFSEKKQCFPRESENTSSRCDIGDISEGYVAICKNIILQWLYNLSNLPKKSNVYMSALNSDIYSVSFNSPGNKNGEVLLYLQNSNILSKYLSSKMQKVMQGLDPKNIMISINTTTECELPVITLQFLVKKYFLKFSLCEIKIKPLILITV